MPTLVEETVEKGPKLVPDEPERTQFIPGLTAFPIEGEREGIYGRAFPRQLDALFSGREKLDEILPPEASMEFGKVLGLASDPQKLKDDTEAALLYSVEMDVPFEESFGLVNEINRISLREQGSSALKRIHQRYNAGVAQLKLGDLGMETLLQTWAKPDAFDARMKEIEQLTSESQGDAGYEWRSFWEKNFQEAAEQIPNMAVAFERGSKWGILGGFAGALAGYAAGGPPGAYKGGQLGLTLFSAVGGASRVYELEAGQQFVSMMQMKDDKGNRIDPRLAVLASHGVGAINGGIEVLQWTTALKAFGISGEVFTKASQAVTKKLFAEKSLQGVLAQTLARFGAALTLETGQEVWQESNNIVFDELSKELNNRMKGTEFKRVTAEELKARYSDITEKSLRSFGIILAPGVGLQGAMMALKVREGLKIDAERNRPIRVYRRAMTGLKATKPGAQLGDIIVERYPLKPPAEGQPTETEIAPGIIERLVDKPVKADEVVTETGEVIEAEDFRSKLSQEDRDSLAEVDKAEKDGILSKAEADELRGAFENLTTEVEKPPSVPVAGQTAKAGAEVAPAEQPGKGEGIPQAEAAKPVEAQKAQEGKRVISKEKYNAAKKRLTDPGTVRMGVGPKDLADFITVGAYHIESGLRTFAAWSNKMIEEFGNRVKPHLQAIWDSAHTLTLEERANAVRQRVKDKISEARTVRKLEEAEPGTKTLPVEEPIASPDKLPSLTAAKNESIQADRELMGLGNLASPERIAWKDSLAQAKIEDIPDRAMRIASEILIHPRALSATETAGLVIKAARLKNEYDAIATKVRNTTDPAETILFSNEAERVESEFGTLSQALRISGTETGRDLVARKLTINRNFDLVSVINRAKVKKQKALTVAERANFTDMVGKLQERETQIQELQGQVDKLVAEQATKQSKRKRYSQMTLEQMDTELLQDVEKVRELLRAGC